MAILITSVVILALDVIALCLEIAGYFKGWYEKHPVLMYTLNMYISFSFGYAVSNLINSWLR